MSDYTKLGPDSVDLGRSSIYIPDFEKSISLDDPEDQVYQLETITQSGIFKTSKGVEYTYTDEAVTYVTKKIL